MESAQRVHLLRWSTFPGRTGWNFGWMDRAQILRETTVHRIVSHDAFFPFSSPEPVVSWSRGRETRTTGRLQIKPSGSGDENAFMADSIVIQGRFSRQLFSHSISSKSKKIALFRYLTAYDHTTYDHTYDYTTGRTPVLVCSVVVFRLLRT